jgi:hypothetical protein
VERRRRTCQKKKLRKWDGAVVVVKWRVGRNKTRPWALRHRTPRGKIQEQLQARKKKRKEKKQSKAARLSPHFIHPSIHPLHRSLMLHIKGEDLIPHPSPKKKGEKKKKSCVMDPLPTQNKKERNSEGRKNF